jgi:hypothetical protein
VRLQRGRSQLTNSATMAAFHEPPDAVIAP